MTTLNLANLKNPSSGSNNIVLNADGTSTLTPSNIIKSGTAVASTSGTSIDFTGLPSWVKRITVMFSGVSTNGTSPIQIQLGDSGGVETSGYLGSVEDMNPANATGGAAISAGFLTSISGNVTAAWIRHGVVRLHKIDGNTWIGDGAISASNNNFFHLVAGSKTLSDTLTQVRVTTVNGTDTFDAGTVNILMEG